MRPTSQGLVAPCSWAALALIFAGFFPVDNPDSFGHLAAGRQIADLGRVPSQDTFSYFRPEPQPWVNYEWLSGWLLFVVYAAAGFAGLTLFKLGLIAAIAVLLVRLAYERAGSLGARLCALLLTAAVPALRFRLTVRPHMFGLLLSAIYWFGLVRILEASEAANPPQRNRSWRWVGALGALHVLWVNLHGSHLLGVALTAAACVASLRAPSARAPLAVLLALEVVASCLSPYGPSIVVGAIEHVFDPRYRAIVTEWQAWTPEQPAWYAVGPALHALCLALAWRGLPSGAAGVFAKIGCIVLIVMAARSMRFIPDFLLLAAPVIAEGIARGWRRLQPRLQGPAWVRDGTGGRVAFGVGAAGLATFAFGMALRLPPYAAFGLGVDLRARPAASSEWLARHLPQARVWAALEDSWFLMWAAPQTRVLMDGRVPFYGPEYIAEMMRRWSSGPSLQRTIAATGTEAVLVQPATTQHQAALHGMLGAADFGLVLIENKHGLFVRGRDGLRALHPGYSAEWLLADEADVRAIRRELDALRSIPNAAVYVAWVDALLALRPLARAEGRAGFAPPRTAAERAAAARALALLRPLRAVLDDMPTLSAYHALAALLACELDEAAAVLARIRDQDVSRESTFARVELDLRAGRLEAVGRFVAEVRALPRAAGDPWLAAVVDGLERPPSCAAHGR